MLANLLGDLLPEAPRESGLLVAGARAGLPGMLRAYLAQGMDPQTAVGLASAALAAPTAYGPARATGRLESWPSPSASRYTEQFPSRVKPARTTVGCDLAAGMRVAVTAVARRPGRAASAVAPTGK